MTISHWTKYHGEFGTEYDKRRRGSDNLPVTVFTLRDVKREALAEGASEIHIHNVSSRNPTVTRYVFRGGTQYVQREVSR